MSKRRRTGRQMIDTIEEVQFTGEVDFASSLELPSRLSSDMQYIITRSEGETVVDALSWSGARVVTDAGGKFTLTRINNQVTLVYEPSATMQTPTLAGASLWVCDDALPGPFRPDHTLSECIAVTNNGSVVIGFFSIAATGVVTISTLNGAFSVGNNAIVNQVSMTYYVN